MKPDRKLKNMTGKTGPILGGFIMPESKPKQSSKCKHGVTPPEYCDSCSVEFKRQPSIDPKAFDAMCKWLKDRNPYGWTEGVSEESHRKELKSALKVYLQRGRDDE